MHTTTTGPSSSTISASSTSVTSTPSSTTTTSNLEQYHYPPISTLRRPSRPSNIDLSVFDISNAHQDSDPAIYSAPSYHLKQINPNNAHHSHHHHQSNSQASFILSPHPHTATFHYQAPVAQQQQQQTQQQNVQLPSHYHHNQTHNIHPYQQQQQQQQQVHHSVNQQQQQHLLDPYSQHQHTPHTFPLQASSNHYHHYFHFPPSNQNLGMSNTNSTPPAYNPLTPSQQQQQQQLTLQANVTNNGHPSPLSHRSNGVASSSTNGSQPSTPTHNNRLLAVQMQERKQPLSNPVLSPLMVKRFNEGSAVASMSIDDDEDPSASIDALVADVDSSSQDLLDDQHDKSGNESKTTSSTPMAESRPSNTSPSPNLYLRGTSHILTTPPNPLASTDHPDNQLTVSNNFQKTFSPIHSAGFELNNNPNNGVSLNSSSRTSFFTFDAHVLEQQGLPPCRNENSDVKVKDDNHDTMKKSILANSDERTNGLNQDDNSSHSSSTTSSQNTNSRNLSQMRHTSTGDRKSLSSSSPSSNEMKISSGSLNHVSKSSLVTQNSNNRHFCSHPDCNKIFANKSALAKHKLTHCQDRKHKCPKCNKGFKRLDHLHGHMLTHEEEKPHKCRVPECNRTYCDARSLKRHIENAHQNILAAIHEGGHDEYRCFLPETAYVKTKDISNDYSIDSAESNSPRSLSIDSEQGIHVSSHLRTSNGSKLAPTYTFDEEKSVECQICKKSFKNGAALNGHMRLHGGFNEKPAMGSSADSAQRKKRSTSPNHLDNRFHKKKRILSTDMHQRTYSQQSISIKDEQEEILMSSPSMIYSHSQASNDQQHYQTLPPCSDVLQHRLLDKNSSRVRSISSSVITPQTSPSMMSHPIKNPLSVQPIPTNYAKQNRRISPSLPHFYDRNNNNPFLMGSPGSDDSLGHLSNSMSMQPNRSPIDQFSNQAILNNLVSNQQQDRTRKQYSVNEPLNHFSIHRQMNGFPPSKFVTPQYFRPPVNQPIHAIYPANFSPFPVSSPSNILDRILRQPNEIHPKDFYNVTNEPHAFSPVSLQNSWNEMPRHPMSNSPCTGLRHLQQSSSPRMNSSPMQDPMAAIINSSSALSPLSNEGISRPSPASSVDPISNSYQQYPSLPSNASSMQPSPTPRTAPKKRFLDALKQENQDESQQQLSSMEETPKQYDVAESCNIEETKSISSQNDENQESSLLSVNSKISGSTESPSIDSNKKLMSAFLITTPSSSSAETNSSKSTSSSSSSHRHFNYENLPATIPTKPVTDNNSISSFQWPLQASQFRRQASMNLGNKTPNPLPTTPYTPPPMLSPFRKGPGLYYQAFSQATPVPTLIASGTTPSTPLADDASGAKINIGQDYQAIIPKLNDSIDNYDKGQVDELLFSPHNMPLLDENSLEKYEQLRRTNPLLFAPRQSPGIYPIELVYMLLYEYQGDLQKTLAVLLDGTVDDIKECRPLHRYHFSECENWTEEEINAFTKALEASDKNFVLISQAVGTKTVKQCVEFYYMPKISDSLRTNGSQGNSSGLMSKRKRLQLMKAKQLKAIREPIDDEISLSSLNDIRSDEDLNVSETGDNSLPAHFSCDIDDCPETFPSERACRAHRHNHRRIKTNQLTSCTIKRSRNIDSNK